MERLGPYEVHPFAAAFPLIDGDEFNELVLDIKRNGLREPIILNHDRSVLIDGRNRWRACDAAGVDQVFEVLPARYTEPMILDLIVSKNMARRQLNPGQRALMALEYERYYADATKLGRPSKEADSPAETTPDLESFSGDRNARTAVAKAARTVGASRSAVAQAKAVQRDAPDLAAKVRSGEIALDRADRERKQRIASMPRPEPAPKPTQVMLTLRTHTGDAVSYPQPQAKATFNETKGEGISWAGWSWNPVTGCLHGCDYCYAREIATSDRFKAAYPAGFTPLFHHERLDAPANTAIPAAHRDDPAYQRVFVCSMADLYGRWVPDEWIDQVHASMCANPRWQYITLTKFPGRYVGLDVPPGAWIGTSVDEQKRVRLAEDAFRQLDGGKVKWLSLEPLKEPLEFTDLSMFDWVVIGAQTETRQPNGTVPAFAPPLGPPGPTVHGPGRTTDHSFAAYVLTIRSRSRWHATMAASGGPCGMTQTSATSTRTRSGCSCWPSPSPACPTTRSPSSSLGEGLGHRLERVREEPKARMPTTLEKQRLNLDCEGRRDDVWLAVCAHRCETHHGYFHQTLARLCAVERGHEHGLPADRVISPRMEYLSTTAASGGIHLHVENHGVIGSQAETDRWLQTSVERLKRRNKL